VRARRDADLAGDGPDLVDGTAVWAALVYGDAPPDRLLFDLREGTLDLDEALGLWLRPAERLDDLCPQRRRGVLHLGLVGDLRDAVYLGAVAAAHFCQDAFVDRPGLDLPLGLTGHGLQLELQVDELLDLHVGDAQRLDDLLFP